MRRLLSPEDRKIAQSWFINHGWNVRVRQDGEVICQENLVSLGRIGPVDYVENENGELDIKFSFTAKQNQKKVNVTAKVT